MPSGRGALRETAAASVVILAALLLCLPVLLSPALPKGSDVSYHAQWVRGFVQALDEGVLYPRWIDDANYRLGAPIFLFYPPLVYYASAAAWWLTSDLVSTLRFVLVGLMVLAGLAFYLSARWHFAPAVAALGAALYSWMPYHAVDLYDRFALGELAAFVWFPPLFAAVARLAGGRDRLAWLVAALSAAGLLLTHLVTAFMAVFVLLPFALLLVGREWRRYLPMLSAGVAGLLLAAVYALPLVVERGRVLMWQDEWFDWRRNFLFSHKVVGSFVGDPIQRWVDGAAMIQLLLALAATAVIVGAAAFAGRRLSRTDWAYVAIALVSFLLQTRLSTPFWAAVTALGEVRFPWRFSAFQALATCLLVCAATAALLHAPDSEPAATSAARDFLRVHRRMGWVTLAIAALPALLLTALVTNARPFTFDRAVADSDVYRYRFIPDYLPRAAGGPAQVRAARDDPQPAARLAGAGSVEVSSWLTHERGLRISAPAATELRVRTYAYPGWQVTVDGRPAPIRAAPPYGIIAVAVPAGRHDVTVRWVPSWDQRLGAWTSAAAAVGLLALALGWARSARTRSTDTSSSASGRKRPLLTSAAGTSSSGHST